MRVEIKTINGWKFNNLEEVATAENACAEFLRIPSSPTDVTQGCLDPVPNYDIRGDIEFYYVGYTYPSQLNEVPFLGDPVTFDITIIIE